MAFCGKCGAKLEEGTKFCSACGAKVEEEKKVDLTAATEKAKEAFDTPDTSADYTEEDKNAGNRWLGALAYGGPLVFIPMFVKKDSPYVQFHVKQGFNLFIFWAAYFILDTILGLIKFNKTIKGSLWGIEYTETVKVSLTSWQGCWPIALLLLLVSLAIAILALIGFIRSLKGKAKELPFIGKMNLLDKFKKK